MIFYDFRTFVESQRIDLNKLKARESLQITALEVLRAQLNCFINLGTGDNLPKHHWNRWQNWFTKLLEAHSLHPKLLEGNHNLLIIFDRSNVDLTIFSHIWTSRNYSFFLRLFFFGKVGRWLSFLSCFFEKKVNESCSFPAAWPIKYLFMKYCRPKNTTLVSSRVVEHGSVNVTPVFIHLKKKTRPKPEDCHPQNESQKTKNEI